MLSAILVMSALALMLGGILGYAAIRFRTKGNPLVDKVDAILPQMQCGQCGFPGCRPYAQAIAEGRADINRCVPGGEAVIQQLADLLGVEPKPLNSELGVTKPKAVAVIDESLCIGCTLCFQACPVDAILGAPKQMHTILSSECTGCELCVAPCPVECIHMEPIREDIGNWKWRQPEPPATANPYQQYLKKRAQSGGES